MITNINASTDENDDIKIKTEILFINALSFHNTQRK